MGERAWLIDDLASEYQYQKKGSSAPTLILMGSRFRKPSRMSASICVSEKLKLPRGDVNELSTSGWSVTSGETVEPGGILNDSEKFSFSFAAGSGALGMDRVV